MSHPRPSPVSFKLILGLVAIALGTALCLENLNLISEVAIYRWWPLLLILLAFGRFWDRGFIWSTGGHILLIVGTVFLMGQNGYDHLMGRWWPLLLIYFGILVAVRSFIPRPPKRCKSELFPDPKATQP